MINALRKKFIFTSVCSVVVVFSAIFLLLALFSFVQMEKVVDTLTDAIASNDGVFPEFEPERRSGPAGLPYASPITEETRFSTRFFAVWLDEEERIVRVNGDAVSSLSREDMESYTESVVEQGRERGWISDYRYKLQRTDAGAIVVFVNASMNRTMTNRLLVTAFLVLLGSASMILVLTVLLSGRAVRPMAESYEKQKQFITDANHELKTPLTLILSNLDIVESEVGYPKRGGADAPDDRPAGGPVQAGRVSKPDHPGGV